MFRGYRIIILLVTAFLFTVKSGFCSPVDKISDISAIYYDNVDLSNKSPLPLFKSSNNTYLVLKNDYFSFGKVHCYPSYDWRRKGTEYSHATNFCNKNISPLSFGEEISVSEYNLRRKEGRLNNIVTRSVKLIPFDVVGTGVNLEVLFKFMNYPLEALFKKSDKYLLILGKDVFQKRAMRLLNTDPSLKVFLKSVAEKCNTLTGSKLKQYFSSLFKGFQLDGYAKRELKDLGKNSLFNFTNAVSNLFINSTNEIQSTLIFGLYGRVFLISGNMERPSIELSKESGKWRIIDVSEYPKGDFSGVYLRETREGRER